MGDLLHEHLGLVRARRAAGGADRAVPAVRYARAFAGTGFLGAYTTFSTFSVEADLLIKDGHAVTAAGYVVASLVAGIAAAWLGVMVGRSVSQSRLRPQEQP